ncbi:MAG: signal recognition particle-docking protein FtsY [Candidatus Marsarchaeota archaeon]|nr:signal recognition particle-docking protein FtsY [Candidatus Marsarchaeota archaeon]
MFDGLKKKLSDALKGFAKKEKEEIEAEAEEEKLEAPKEKKEDKPAEIIEIESKPAVSEKEVQPQTKTVLDVKKPERIEETVRIPAAKPKVELHVVKEEVKAKKEEKQEAVKISLSTKLKGALLKSVSLKESEVDDFVETVRVSMLESDVSYEATDVFTADLKNNIMESKFDSKNIQGELVSAVRKSMLDLLSKGGKGINLYEFVRSKASSGELPVKILFLGPNGTGKTTTLAKIAYHMKKNGITCLFSASDTFRAAAIEQTEHHANKVGVPVIKSRYGADPASIAFDAIAYAKAHGVQAVLIDTAGRQETNKNLISEMQKMVRVAKPDITVFIGESTAGNRLSEQIKEFGKFMKIDGIILTKLDCDAKGGNAISIAHSTGIPILFLGTGESYEALVEYTPDFIVNAILPNN